MIPVSPCWPLQYTCLKNHLPAEESKFVIVFNYYLTLLKLTFMKYKRQCLFYLFILLIPFYVNAQIEVDYVKAKKFNAIGFGGFLSFSFPIQEADYITVEGAAQYLKNNSTSEEMYMVPMLTGYRYTIDRSGMGLFIEPCAGYIIGSTDASYYDESGNQTEEVGDFQGLAAGAGVGYLFDLGNISFNVSIRYLHGFGKYQTNTLGLRLAHSISFGRRNY